MKNNKGFTLIEMIFCISVILIILLLVIPNVTSKNAVDKGKLPTSIHALTSGSNPYLTKKQATCPNGKKIAISNGQAYVK